MPPLALSLGPLEVKLGLALGLLLQLVLLEALASWVLRRLGWAGRGRVARLRPLLALLLPLALLAPRLEGVELLAPTHHLRGVPGVPDLGPGPWDLLNDSIFQFLPWEAEVRRALAEGRAPLWSDRLQSSPWSNPQAQVASPVALAARLFPLEHFLLAALAAKLLLAFDGAWALAGALGARPLFRALAGLSFTLGGGMMAWALFPQSSALALVPWLAAATVSLARRDGRRERLAAALATAALAVGGHPEIALAGGLFAAVAGLALGRRGIRPRGAALVRLTGAAALGLALAAPLWLPFAFEVGESQRWAELAGERQRAATTPPVAERSWFHPAHVALLESPLGPEVFGRPYFGTFEGPFNWVWAEGGYAGLAALAGIAAALAARATRARVLPLALFALVALVAAARFTPLAALVEAVPPLRAVALERALPIATLALAVAGALGAEALARRRRVPSRPRPVAVRGPRPTLDAWLPVAAVALAAAVSLAARTTPRTTAAWLLLAAAVALAPRRRTVAALALATALFVDLGLFARDFLPAGFARQFWPESALLAELVRRGGDEPFRVAALDMAAYPASLAMYGLEDVRVHDPLADQRYLDLTGPAFGFAPDTVRYFSDFARPDHPLGAFLGLRFVLSRSATAPPPGWTPIAHPGTPGWVASEAPALEPRIFLARAVELVPRGEWARAVATLADSRTALLEPSVEARRLAALAPPGAGESVDIVSRRDGRFRLRTELATERLVATSLLEPESWHIRAAGARLAPVAIHGAFLGFAAPAGELEIELDFVPRGLAAGLAAAAAGLPALALFVGAARSRRRRLTPSSGSKRAR